MIYSTAEHFFTAGRKSSWKGENLGVFQNHFSLHANSSEIGKERKRWQHVTRGEVGVDYLLGEDCVASSLSRESYDA